MKKASAIAPANIAFIKYWGKNSTTDRIPQNDSISMNLSAMTTHSTVEFSASLKQDDIVLAGEKRVLPEEINRIKNALDLVRHETGIAGYARIMTRNNFPKATGIASSASGFASIALAAFAALSYRMNEADLSRFCRRLSGTACRSIPDGIVRWYKGHNDSDSFAKTIHAPDYWNIRDVVAVVTSDMKKVSSTLGHSLAPSSPFYTARMSGMDQKITDITKALDNRDFSRFGQILEAEALNMHSVCLTSTPGLIYWEPATVRIMKSIQLWRENGELESYFTIDAGPSVHVICRDVDSQRLQSRLEKLPETQSVVVNNPAMGARMSDSHLF